MDESPMTMSIAVFTRFYPSFGGIQTIAELLASEWTAAGHKVTVVTSVPNDPNHEKDFPFEVVRRPRPSKLLQVVRDCDLLVYHNISLKAMWPLLVMRRPLVGVHHGFYLLRSERKPWRERMKVWIARHWTHNICVSQAVHRSIGAEGSVIPNLYDNSRFRLLDRMRNKELLFVGRLVSEKGVHVLLDSLSELARRGITPSLTIIGDGPERSKIQQQIQRLGLETQVALFGRQDQAQIAQTMNEHKILVIPSVCEEAFGIVALEGAACGCVVVGSNGGGLPEAIGPCGTTFPIGDHQRLAAILEELLGQPGKLDEFRRMAPAHLDAHRTKNVSAKYLQFFREVSRGRIRRSIVVPDRATCNAERHHAEILAENEEIESRCAD
jgi:glycosyltransferase involved in cell wall biosynthesis